MNEMMTLASAAGMTVGLAVCALIAGLVLAMIFAGWESLPGNADPWPAGNSGGAVYLFWRFTAAAHPL
jgi:ABC-type arginine transport system permease subunit